VGGPAGDTPPGFRDAALPLRALPPDAVAGLGVGWYRSPTYLGLARGGLRIAGAPSGRPHPGPLGDDPVAFVVVLPAGARPAGGWPVVIVGHGYGGEMFGTALLLAGTLARHGLATVAITVVGHGGGPDGRLLVEAAGAWRVVRVPGRGVDLDGDGRIAEPEGLQPLAGGPLAALGLRDGLRQQVVDLMALRRALAGGLDVDGDGAADTAREPFSYVGHSLGGIYGTLLAAVEPGLRAAVLSVPGGPVTDVARLSPAFRPRLREVLARRVPPLLGPADDLDAALPLAGPPGGRGAPGPPAVEAFLARTEWLGRRGDPVAFARHLRLAPLPGVEPAAVLVQWARGDRVVPNATTGALLAAGALADVATVFRHDRVADRLDAAFAEPHGFLLWTGAPGLAGAIGRAAQDQAARFLRSPGPEVPVPGLRVDGVAGPLFEASGAGG
jgi:hypothetical protein